jgi:regulator of protease activity HflC (stomatin/prohibitin superfamily)
VVSITSTELRDVMAGANRSGPLFIWEVHEAQQKRKNELLLPEATAARAITKAQKEASNQRAR